MNKKLAITLLAALFPTFAMAHNITVGEPIPSVTVADKGEILVENDEVVYQAWNSEQLKGKVRIIQAIAGRSAAKAMNADLMTAITDAGFPADKYQTTTIINQGDAMWGTGGFVKSSAEDSKREFSWSSMVLDATGSVHADWELTAENSAIIVLDKETNVLFVKEGKLSAAEIQQALDLVKQSL
ncbi:YtfJ family protein [Photobacterium sanctipauli]|uniref:YtfJ family protein n=1 Tax=Photobacterium sanctipauli TaxID=1342794 RepID=A0A2T3NIS7_9GAMM|nr:YtfJ family protein [Photobacterium sanctipauli]PSW15165.1 YtfJ family protein [Photobacterium sanctipauli]